MQTIPFVDLYAQYLTIKNDIDTAIANVITGSHYIGGETVKKFETEYAADYGVAHCISVANGTDAIYIALRMLGIGEGDEVITTAHSWISTSEAVSQTGAKPVFVDVDEYYLINTDLIESKITPRTKMIIPVHLCGQAANMTRIMELAHKYNLLVMEDCAQSHYAEWEGQRIGTFGIASTFSFYPGKNLGAYGDAGAILTNNDVLASKMRMFANHGALKKHDHHMEGINSRLDGMQAAILSAKLPHIHEWTAARRKVASWYNELLGGVEGIMLPAVRNGATHVFHLYMVQVDNRDSVMKTLGEQGIQTAVHYPVPLPLMKAYDYLSDEERLCPVATTNKDKIMSLPIFPEITREQVDYVANTLKSIVKK